MIALVKKRKGAPGPQLRQQSLTLQYSERVQDGSQGAPQPEPKGVHDLASGGLSHAFASASGSATAAEPEQLLPLSAPPPLASSEAGAYFTIQQRQSEQHRQYALQYQLQQSQQQPGQPLQPLHVQAELQPRQQLQQQSLQQQQQLALEVRRQQQHHQQQQESLQEPIEQQRALLLLQMPLVAAAPQQLQPPMLHEPAEAPTTASSLTQAQRELIATNREAALRRRQDVQQQQVQPQDAAAQQTQLEQPQPSGGQQARAASSDPGNVHTCIICMEDLHSMRVQALPCMHCFHKRCLEAWQQCTDKPAHHCPLRCHLTINSRDGEDTEDEDEIEIGGDGGLAQQPPGPSAPVGDELAQLIEAAIAS